MSNNKLIQLTNLNLFDPKFHRSTSFDSDMDSKSNIYSPTLQRRRLSVPETIMRK